MNVSGIYSARLVYWYDCIRIPELPRTSAVRVGAHEEDTRDKLAEMDTNYAYLSIVVHPDVFKPSIIWSAVLK